MFALMDDETALRCLQQILDQLGIKYRRTMPGEEGGFFYEDEDGNYRKFTGERERDPIVKSIEALSDRKMTTRNQNE